MNKLLSLSFCVSCIPAIYANNKVTNKPNVVFILVDDMGYTDLGCTGSSFYETPHIDCLAAESVSFQSAYAACPVSSPSRAAIMTGKYPARINLTDYIPGNQSFGINKNQKMLSLPFNLHLDKKEVTIAEAFLQNGYSTFFAGKWHLAESVNSESDFPTSFGFQVNKGGNYSGLPAGGYFSPYKNPQLPDGPKGEYITDRLTDEVIKFVKEKKESPFFVYLSYYAVHLPMQAKQNDIEKYERKRKMFDFQGEEFVKQGDTYFKMNQNMPIYAAMIESLDQNIGRLIQCLKDEGLDGNTIIIFTSDNGGMATSNRTDNIPTSNLPLRSGKGTLYEGGIRVPTFVRWKGVIQPRVIKETPIIGTDFYPTLLDLCQLPLLPKQHIDGVSFAPLLKGETFDRGPIFWHYPHYSGGLGGCPSAAVRQGNYKLIEFFEDKHVELYDVVNDKSEKTDLSGKKPRLMKRMKKQLYHWYRNVNAQMPIKNPYYESQ